MLENHRLPLSIRAAIDCQLRAEICQNIGKLMIILLILGSFQLYAPNNYSLPTAAVFITLWFMGKLNNWQEPPQSFKDLNREVLRDIKENVEDIKKIIR